MDLINLISEIQSNPRNTSAYRNIVKYYHSQGMIHEAESFSHLLEVEFTNEGSDHSGSNQKQSGDNKENP